MLILGAKFKFSVSHRKFNFPLYAYIVCVIRSNSCCFFCHRDNNRSRLEKVPRLHYSLKKFCIFFDRYAKKWFQERQKCEDLSADRCFLLSIPYFFVFAGADGTFFLGYWAWYCHKFLQKNGMLLQESHRRVDREIGDIYSSMHKCYPFTRLLFNYKTAIVIQVS